MRRSGDGRFEAITAGRNNLLCFGLSELARVWVCSENDAAETRGRDAFSAHYAR